MPHSRKFVSIGGYYTHQSVGSEVFEGAQARENYGPAFGKQIATKFLMKFRPIGLNPT